MLRVTLTASGTYRECVSREPFCLGSATHICVGMYTRLARARGATSLSRPPTSLKVFGTIRWSDLSAEVRPYRQNNSSKVQVHTAFAPLGRNGGSDGTHSSYRTFSHYHPHPFTTTFTFTLSTSAGALQRPYSETAQKIVPPSDSSHLIALSTL